MSFIECSRLVAVLYFRVKNKKGRSCTQYGVLPTVCGSDRSWSGDDFF